MRIITGSTGTTHVTSNDDGEFNQGIFGKNLIVLNNGNHLSAAIVDNNTVRISDGDLIFQGRHALIEPNTIEDITIETGAVGINRNDLIVARYTLDSSTGYENITLEVIKGTETSGVATDPKVTTGDIRTGDVLAEVALYRVKIEGINIVKLETLFTVTKDIIGLIVDLQKANSDLNTNLLTYKNTGKTTIEVVNVDDRFSLNSSYSWYIIRNGICYFQIYCTINNAIDDDEKYMPFFLPKTAIGSYVYFNSSKGSSFRIGIEQGGVRVACYSGQTGTQVLVGSYPIG